MDRGGELEDELWDEGDGFFYDLLRFPDGRATRLKVRSLVGLLSLCASHLRPSRDTYLDKLRRLGRLDEDAA